MKKHQEGSAMIVVMCVMTVTTALCLALLLTASVSIQNAARSNRKEQCRINAVSVSKVLIEEISTFRYGDTLSEGNYDTVPDEGEEVSDTGSYRRPIAPATQLRDKLQTVNTNTWYANNSDIGKVDSWATSGQKEYTYILQNEDALLPGITKVSLYWINENEEAQSCPDAFHPEDAAEWFGNIKLYLKVTSTVGTESSTIISCFEPIVDQFSDETVTPSDGELQKKWASWYWKYLGHEWERGES